MKRTLRKSLTAALAVLVTTSVVAACGQTSNTTTGTPGTTPDGTTVQGETQGGTSAPTTGEKIKISLTYSDNPTLPFKTDWLTVQTVQEKANVELQFEVIPIADYQTKLSLMLNTQDNIPDVLLYQSTGGENAALALNVAIVPIADYADWTPNFNQTVEAFGLQDEVADKNLKDGKRYYMPSLFDKQFYDGGLILREDYLTEKGLEAPKTYDDLYTIAKQYKSENPDSYPILPLVGARVLYRMTMPSFGVSLGQNAASGTWVLSYDYENKNYFAGAISDQYKEYLTFFNKLYAEGLLDPEFLGPIDGDAWAQKMATGQAMATWAYYDQIGGVESASTIDGFKLNLYPALEGPAGAHHQPKSRLGAGPLFPAKTAERDDFEQVVRKIDEVFFSEEMSKIWNLGVEGTTYTMDGDKIVYSDDITSSPDGIYKTMQVKYGAGSDVTQMVWHFDREMTKYDENYAKINQEVAAMDDVIQPIPPTPLFDELTADEASTLQTPLADKFEVWASDFIIGNKSLDTDWDTYVNEMKDQGIETMVELYNNNLR